MSKMDALIIIGVVLMTALWIGTMFNLGDLATRFSRLFHWIESQR
ncbi:hypothetical protein ACOMDM_08925 [Serratia plymuthica]|nr:hypothetical protein [Serratia plymuthica]ANJ91739.1 membrane protein [Serratia plymuthica]ANJ98098.1 membrane protein [Serratia plymuthica]